MSPKCKIDCEFKFKVLVYFLRIVVFHFPSITLNAWVTIFSRARNTTGGNLKDKKNEYGMNPDLIHRKRAFPLDLNWSGPILFLSMALESLSCFEIESLAMRVAKANGVIIFRLGDLSQKLEENFYSAHQTVFIKSPSAFHFFLDSSGEKGEGLPTAFPFPVQSSGSLEYPQPKPIF